MSHVRTCVARRKSTRRPVGVPVKIKVPDQQVPCVIEGDDGKPIGCSRAYQSARLVPPELAEVASGLPPEVAPGEAALVVVCRSGPQVVKDILGQLELMGIECLPGAPEALGVAVSVDKSPLTLGPTMLFFGLADLAVGAGDLVFELPAVPPQPTGPCGDAAGQPPYQEDHKSQQCGHGGPAPRTAPRPLPGRDRPAQDRPAVEKPSNPDFSPYVLNRVSCYVISV